MMQQYLETKSKYTDCILFYRLGDFYEMFFEDAKIASSELDLTLTGKDCGMESRAPMCGIPFHAADNYIAKLVKRGFKVAICEQLEDPATAKGIVKRDVIRIITPGTVTEGSLLVDGKNNYLCAIYIDGSKAGFAVSDISTAQVYVTNFDSGDVTLKLLNELGVYAPSEVIINLPENDVKELSDFIKIRLVASLSCDAKERFSGKEDLLKKQFGNDYSAKNGLDESPYANIALGALIDYISEMQKTDISYIDKINYYSNEQFLSIDINTRRNLELCETMRSREKRGSLLWVLDKTKTAMGARLIRKWTEQPLLSCNLIEKRQNAVSSLFDDMMTCDDIANILSKVNDIERLMTKIVYNTANGRDLRALGNTINQIPEIKKLLSGFSSPLLSDLHNNMDALSDIGKIIDDAIIDEPPLTIREG